jgi:hypothetical protein
MRVALIVGLSVTLFAAGFYLATAIKEPGSAVAALVGTVSIYSSFLVALATVVLVIEARKTREAQTAPDISVSFTQANRAGVVYIIIKNDGAGTARNIRFSVAGDIKTHRGTPLAEASYMKQGFRYLVPDQQIRTFFATASEVMEYITDSQMVTISAHYEGENGRRYKKEFPNDFAALENTTRSDLPIEKIGSELERLRKVIEKTAR